MNIASFLESYFNTVTVAILYMDSSSDCDNRMSIAVNDPLP
jgi:hypothetical protein